MWNKLIIFLACVLIYFYKRSAKSDRSSLVFYCKYVLYYFTIIMCAACYWPLFLFNPCSVQNMKLILPVGKALTKIIGITWEVRNSEVLSADRGAVIVSNHQSCLDLLAISQVWETIDKLACIAKKELFYLWPFGLTAYLTGTVFVDRQKPKEAYKQLYSVSELMVHDKTKIWIFPEGTRNKNKNHEFLPFKKGAFKLAVSSQVPIVPVVLCPYYFVDREKRIFDEGHMIMQCLEEVPTTGMTLDDVPDLIESVRNKMMEFYKQLTKEVINNPTMKYTWIR